MRAAIEEARKAGRRTAAHAQGSDGDRGRGRRGHHHVEHGIFLTEEIVARMQARGRVPGAHPQRARRHRAGGLAAGIPDYMVRKSDAVVPAHVASFQLAQARGVASRRAATRARR